MLHCSRSMAMRWHDVMPPAGCSAVMNTCVTDGLRHTGRPRMCFALCDLMYSCIPCVHVDLWIHGRLILEDLLSCWQPMNSMTAVEHRRVINKKETYQASNEGIESNPHVLRPPPPLTEGEHASPTRMTQTQHATHRRCSCAECTHRAGSLLMHGQQGRGFIVSPQLNASTSMVCLTGSEARMLVPNLLPLSISHLSRLRVHIPDFKKRELILKTIVLLVCESFIISLFSVCLTQPSLFDQPNEPIAHLLRSRALVL